MERIIEAALKNVARTSRTSRGVSDTTSSADKPKLSAEGAALAELAQANFVEALSWALAQDASSPAELYELVEGVATRVSRGLLQPGQGIWRTWETEFGQTAPAELLDAMSGFAANLAAVLRVWHPVETAAWVKWALDFNIHPFADGCGRSSDIMSLWVLRNQDLLPEYPSREEIYAHAAKPLHEWQAFYRTICR